MTKCKGCGQQMPMELVQQGGYHIDCANEEITVYAGNPGGCGGPVIVTEKELESFLDEIKSLDVEECFIIEKRKMSRIELDNLPEHQGW